MYFDLPQVKAMKNTALAVGMVAAVVLAFYPIYFRPKFFPEEYSEYMHVLDAYINYWCVL